MGMVKTVPLSRGDTEHYLARVFILPGSTGPSRDAYLLATKENNPDKRDYRIFQVMKMRPRTLNEAHKATLRFASRWREERLVGTTDYVVVNDIPRPPAVAVAA